MQVPWERNRRVHWLDELPTRITGLVLGNEVLDALPVHIVAWREDRIMERGVTWDGEVFSSLFLPHL